MHELSMGRGTHVSLFYKRTRQSFLGLWCLVALSLLSIFPCAVAQSTTAAPPTAVSTTARPPMPQGNTPPRTPRPPVSEAMSPETPAPTADIVVPPTMKPTESLLPSPSPTESPRPTVSPTSMPTITPRPTNQPSVSPTDFPSSAPSFSPSAEPTFANEVTARTVFNQRFQIGNQREFNETEQVWFCDNMEGYTDDFGGRDDGRVNTTCRIISQRLQIIGGSRFLRDGNSDKFDGVQAERRLQGVVFNQVEYGMSYSSNHTNVSTYPTLFQNYVNEDLDRLTTDLQNAGLLVTNSFLAFNNIATLNPTTIPTITPSPTSPTVAPSAEEVVPTMAPSPVFTRDPSLVPETAVPSSSPNSQPFQPSGTRRSTTIIATSVAVAFCILIVALLVFYKRRRNRFERKFQVEAAAAGAAAAAAKGGAGDASSNNRDMRIDTGQPIHDTMKNGKQDIVQPILSPADSLRSKDSLLSSGPSPLSEGSEREEDGTHNLADEFDRYKDQNLETLRTGVEDNLSGFDGMMSQALTKVLIDDESEDFDNDLLWGGSGDSIEIEATALYEVTDWIKRNDRATVEEKGKFIQETLDRMVASVRHGVMDPVAGSRTIHECAALLGLQLATGIRGDTLIVTGMPKWVQRNDLLSAFSEFGEIEEAAVAAQRRGFGLVRFKHLRGVNAALSKFRTGEIVVQDVAVMIKVLRSDDVERPRTWEPGFPPPPPVQNLSRHSSRAASPILK